MRNNTTLLKRGSINQPKNTRFQENETNPMASELVRDRQSRSINERVQVKPQRIEDFH